jgi:PAS domain S-box-containing protein
MENKLDPPERDPSGTVGDDELLSQLKAQLRAFDAFPMPVAMVDQRGSCWYSNQKFTNISGVTSFEGRRLHELISNEADLATVGEQLRRRFESHESAEYNLTDTRLSDGKGVPVRISSTPVSDGRGRVVAAIAIVRDLTGLAACSRMNPSSWGRSRRGFRC